MSLLKVLCGFNTSTTYHSHAFTFSKLLHYSFHFVFNSHYRHKKVIIVTKKNNCTLRHPYRTRAKARIMSEVEEVQEQMKADMEAMKDQMATMMEAMLSMKKIMESITAAVATTSAAVEVDLTHPSGVNKISRPILDVVGQRGEALGSTGEPHVVQSKNSFLPYGLPPNYAPPNAVHVPDENADHFAPVPFQSQQPQLAMHILLSPWGGM